MIKMLIDNRNSTGRGFSALDKYAEKEDRLLVRDLEVISKDAKRVSKTIISDQRNLIRRSHSVQATMDGRRDTKARPDSPIMPHQMLYGSANMYTSCANSRYSYNQTKPQRPLSRTQHQPYSQNLMRDLRSIANKSLSDLDSKKYNSMESSEMGNRRQSSKETRNNRADNLLEKNLSKWHTDFQRSSTYGSNGLVTDHTRRRKVGHTAEMNRSYSCDLPRIISSANSSAGSSAGSTALSKYSRKSEPIMRGSIDVTFPSILK